jgi:predicted enzyme related to lactoylglutathione lyase
MGERTSYEPGTFSWADLATTDADGAKAFYTELFGWEPDDQDAGDGRIYTMLRVDGKNVAAMYEQGERQREQGIPPNWASYITVENVDESTERARSLGANVMMEPFDVMDVGRMAVVADPQGAAFPMWQGKGSIGAELVNEVGALCWNELATSDTAAAQDFYGQLFGWTFEPIEHEGEVVYTTIKRPDGGMNGGMNELTPEHGGAPPHWLPYFAVESLEEATGKIEDAGGAVVTGPIQMPAGRIAVARDPQGAAFAIWEGDLEP